MEYFAELTQTRAANANGLYNLSIADKYIKQTTPDTEKIIIGNSSIHQ